MNKQLLQEVVYSADEQPPLLVSLSPDDKSCVSPEALCLVDISASSSSSSALGDTKWIDRSPPQLELLL